MFRSIWDDIRQAFRTGNMVTRLVIVNFSVFALLGILRFVLFMFNAGHGVPGYFYDGLYLFCMPSDWQTLLWHPWSPLTYMFLHEGFWHVLSNIIFLYLFGNIIGDLVGDRRVLPIYLLGGLAGGFLFFLSAFFMYMSPYALGASGAVMALAGAAVTLAPDYRVMLLLLGEVRLKYIVLVMVLLDLISIANQDNTGGHVAHIGGFATGIFLVSRLRDGQDLLDPVHELWLKIQSWFTPSARPRPMRRPPENTRRRSTTATQSNTSASSDEPSFQEKLDAILDKIRETGYENLTQEEKDFLFRASKK